MIVLYIVLAIVVLMLLILVHELGHYTAGKLFGFKINEFSIGFGPAIFKKTKKNGEVFALRWIPLGGYCAFEGEDEDNKNPLAFNNQKPWKRLIVLFAGVFFNFIFGLITAFVFLLVSGNSIPKISAIAPNNPNSFVVGDEIVSANGKTIEAYRPLSDIVKGIDAGENFEVVVDRDGQEVKFNVAKTQQDAYTVVGYEENLTKVFDKDGNSLSKTQFIELYEADGSISEKFFKSDLGSGGLSYEAEELNELLAITSVSESISMGILYGNVGRSYNFFECMWKAFPFCIYICQLILFALVGLFTGATRVSDLGGTVTAVAQIAEISQLGINQFLLLLPLLSMNLALFNALPIPALDGARMVFVLIEWIFRKPVPRKIEGWIHTVGLFVLLGFVVFLDVYHFFF